MARDWEPRGRTCPYVGEDTGGERCDIPLTPETAYGPTEAYCKRHANMKRMENRKKPERRAKLNEQVNAWFKAHPETNRRLQQEWRDRAKQGVVLETKRGRPRTKPAELPDASEGEAPAAPKRRGRPPKAQ